MQSWYGDTGLVFYNYKDTINPFLTVRTSDSTGAFLDDRWSPTKRLSITLGLRFDWMTSKYDKGKVYDFVSSPEEINGPPRVLRNRAGSDNVYDFKTWSPRVGASYQLTEDGKTVVRAAWGRYYLPVSLENLRRFGPDVPTLTRDFQLYSVGPWDTVDTNGDGEIDTLETRAAARRVAGTTPYRATPARLTSRGPSTSRRIRRTSTQTSRRSVLSARSPGICPSRRCTSTSAPATSSPTCQSTARPARSGRYDRVPFTTQSGEQVQLYSVVEQDYNGDGLVDSDDIAWIGDNGTSLVKNLPEFDGVKTHRGYHGLQLVANKRYADRWQALASFLYSNSSGFARRSLRQDVNVEGPMFWDDNWMATPNQTINNLDGPLPFTPKYEFKLSGSYLDPEDRARRRPATAHAQRPADVAARNLPAAHAVRVAGRRRHRIREARARSSASLIRSISRRIRWWTSTSTR